MRRWDALNDRQLTLLRQIGEGDDLSGADGVSHRTSARALQTRGLVDVTRKGGVWRATVTEAGLYYLEHKRHPDHPDMSTSRPEQAPHSPGRVPQVAKAVLRTTSSPRVDTSQSGAIVTRARSLIEQLEREGGTVRLESPDASTRALYRRIIHAAKQHGLVPEGHQLLYTGRSKGDVVIMLSDGSEASETDWNRIRLNARRDTTNPEVVFTALEKDPAALHVTEALVANALDLLRRLAEEARRRGHRLGVKTKTKHPKIYLQVGRVHRTVEVHEEYDEVPHVPTAQELREQRRNPWRMLPEFDRVPSGRLRLQVARAGWNQHDSWSDTKRSKLQNRLRQVIHDIETAVATDEEARLAAIKEHQEQIARWEKEDAERKARWQKAVAEARVQAVEALRRDTFRRAYDAWIAAGEIRAFCNALEQTCHHDTTERAANLARWIAWARSAADQLYPVSGASALDYVNHDIEPTPEDLRPWLGEWSPHEPEREYRSERDEQNLAEIRHRAETWHPGMRGQRAWWCR